MNKKALIWGSLLGMLGVMIGAFGAHGLNDLLIANGKHEVFETGVRYHFYHAFALLILGVLSNKVEGIWIKRSAYFFLFGIIIFSGSLYILSLSNVSAWGMITPIGGVSLIAGWISLLLGIVRQGNNL